MQNRGRVTVAEVLACKGKHPRLLAMTAYDYPLARLLDEEGVDILHVGDSLGMMVLGHKDTTRVTMEQMLFAVDAVARARRHAMVTADLPIGTYVNPESALQNSRRLLAAGADAVKMEGGHEILPQVRYVISAGIPVQAHLGMLPQRVLIEGGYRRKAKDAEGRRLLLADALAVQEAGCFSCVIECVAPEAAAEVTAALTIPTLGIAAGTSCDGEIRVTHDVLGLFPWYRPPYIQPVKDLFAEARPALQTFRRDCCG